MLVMIEKSIQSHRLLDMVYLSECGQVSQRRIKVLKMKKDFIYAFCFLRQSTRSFRVNNILALEPVATKRNMVI